MIDNENGLASNKFKVKSLQIRLFSNYEYEYISKY